MGREVALPSFLDQIQINRNIPRRGKHCGRYSIRGRNEKSGRTVFHRVNCKCWNCSFCAPRKAKRYKRAIREVAEAFDLRIFLTLTLDPSKIEGDPVRYLNGVFAKFRTYLKRELGRVPKYIRVLGFQKNGNPHFHLLIDRCIGFAWVQEAWLAVGLNATQIQVRQRCYRGDLDSPKTRSSKRTLPLPKPCLDSLRFLKAKCGSTEGPALVFQTSNGTPYSDTNILHRELKPAGQKIGAPWLSWHAFRRTHQRFFRLRAERSRTPRPSLDIPSFRPRSISTRSRSPRISARQSKIFREW